MAIHFVYGSSVSDKSEKIYDYMIRGSEKNPEKNYIAIVPEQASLSVQQDLVMRHPRHALLNIDILTFSRLAYKVFEAMKVKTGNTLDETGKLMLFRLITEELESKLTVLKRNLHREGFLSEVKSVISELVQYNIAPDTLSAYAENMTDHPLLQGKLRDISLIYREFLKQMHENYELAEERLVKLSELLPEWPDLSRTVFTFLEYTGFTPLQYLILETMIRNGADIIVDVTVGQGKSPEEQLHEEDLFYMGAHMMKRLKTIADAAGVPWTEECAAETRPCSDTIRHLEKTLFVYPRVNYPAEPQVTVKRAAVPGQEVSLVVHEIKKSLQEGYELRDLAVIAGDPEGYKDELEAQLTDAGIPYFLDVNRDLSMNPMLLLLKNALTVPENGFSFEDTINYGKNPIVQRFIHKGLAEGDVLSTYERLSEVDNYARATGVRGKKRWNAEFTRTGRMLKEERLPLVNEVRRLLVEPLVELDAVLHKRQVTVSERVDALKAFLDTLESSTAMMEFSENLSPENEKAMKDEYDHTAEKLDTLLNSMADILGERRLAYDVFSEVLQTGIHSLRMGIVPPTKDLLMIGDLTRTRLNGIKKLYIIGANDGVLPPKQAESGILTDYDRNLMKDQIALAPTAREESFFMQLYLYLLLTEPSESVYMTYAAADNSGKAAAHSFLVDELRSIFPSVRAHEDCNGQAIFNTKKQSLSELARAFRTFMEDPAERPSEELKALYQCYVSSEEGRDMIRKLENGALYHYEKEKLSDNTISRIFRDILIGSPTNLENYARCAYKHFLNYGLKLKERIEFSMEAKDYGSVYHACIDRFFREMNAVGKTLDAYTLEEQHTILQRVVEEVLSEDRNSILDDNMRNAYAKQRIYRLAERTVRTLTEQWNLGGFTKTTTEQQFSGGDALPALRVELDNGLALNLEGIIDRMDTGKVENRLYVKVIDYKSGSKVPDFTEIYYGLQLQLLLYMRAAQEIAARRNPGAEIIPAGVYYYHLDDPVVDYKEGKSAEELIMDKLRMKGITNNDPEAVLMIDKEAETKASVVTGLKIKKDGTLEDDEKIIRAEDIKALCNFAEKKAKGIAEEMSNGDISVNPYMYDLKDSCTYCPYQAVCGFDDKIPGYKKRRLKKKKLEDLIDMTE